VRDELKQKEGGKSTWQQLSPGAGRLLHFCVIPTSSGGPAGDQWRGSGGIGVGFFCGRCLKEKVVAQKGSPTWHRQSSNQSRERRGARLGVATRWGRGGATAGAHVHALSSSMTVA
jgi:hypothetical protein